VDIGYIFEQIKQTNKHEGGFDCTYNEMEFIEEKRYGFFSKYIFKCKMCNIQQIISSEDINDDSYMSINQAVVNGTISVGTIFFLLYIFFINLKYIQIFNILFLYNNMMVYNLI